jgi:hypothetical protein
MWLRLVQRTDRRFTPLRENVTNIDGKTVNAGIIGEVYHWVSKQER